MPLEKPTIQPFILERVIERNPPLVTTETTVSEAIARMSQIRHQSCLRASCQLDNVTDSNSLSDLSFKVRASSSYLLVMEAEQLVGIFTERDLVKLAASEYDCSALKIAEVMTDTVVTLPQSEARDIFDVLSYFRRHRIRHLPILDERERLLGVITTGSLRQALQPHNFLRLRQVADVMATEVVTASANDSVLNLARLMSDRQVSCVVITEAKENEERDNLVTPIGIITEGDIVQFQALGLNLKKIQAETVMSSPLFPVKPLDALWQVNLQMQQHRVRRLVVTGERGELVGIITQTRLLQILDPLEILQELQDLQQINKEQTLQLEQTNRQLQDEIAERERLENALREANRALTQQVDRQTTELGVTKEVLQQEIKERRRSQRQRDRFFDLSLDLFCIAGVDGYFKQVNPAMERVLGFSTKELLAKPFIDFVHPDDRAATIDEDAKIVRGTDTVTFENRYRCQDGSYKWLLWTATFSPEEQLIYASAKEITERKSTLDSLEDKVAERTAKLEQANKRLELAQFSLDRNVEIIAWISPQAEILYANDSACRVLGYTHDELLSRNVAEVVAAFSPTAWAEHWQQLRTRGWLQLETSLRTKSGKAVAIEAITQYLEVDGREYNCVFGRDISERKQIEKALSDSEKRFKTLVANVPGAIYRCANDSNWTIVFIGDEIEAISGYAPADLIDNRKLTFNSMIYAKDCLRVFREAQVAIDKRKPYTVEYRLLRSDGTIVWVKDKGQAIYDNEGNFLWLDGIILDITERKWSEILQQVQNQILNMLARREKLEDILLKLTEQINRLSPGLYSSIMMMEEDGRHLRPVINSSMPQDYIQEIDYLLIGAKVASCGTAAYLGQRVVVSNITTDPLWADYKHLILPHGFQACWSEPIKSETGKVLGTFGMYFTEARSPKPKELEIIEACADLASIVITRKKSETKLQQSEARLRLTTDALPALVSYVDNRQCYRFVNQAYEDWFAHPRTEIIGRSISQLLGEADYLKIKQYIESALSGQTVTYENDIELSDRQVHWVRVTHIPDLDREGEVKGFFTLVNDISDRKATERMKDEFVSVVSHELRTPLTSIYGALKLLATSPESDLAEEDREMLTIAVTNTERLVRLVNDILDLERIESGKVKIVKQACDAADLISEAVDVMQPMADSQDVSLVAEPISIHLWADSDHIQQTLTNLLSNAIKFSSPNSSVWVTAENQEHEVLFKVGDRGRGIPADRLELIFERFQQVDASDSRDKGGTGLGLTICYKIVEEHGGRIWAESKLGEGSTFCFTLPKSNSESAQKL